MKHQQHQFKTKDGLNLFAQSWIINAQKGIICMVHGMGEHSSRFEGLAHYLNEQQYSVFAFDLRGHGRSEGQRGHSPDYEFLLDDVEDFLKLVDNVSPYAAKFLFGHSLGANIVLNYGLKRQPNLNGLISSSAYLKLAFQPPAFKVWLGKMIKRIYPKFTLDTELDATALSRDPDEVEAYKRDILVHSKISAAMYFGISEAGLWALEKAEDLNLPLFIYHGTADRLTSFEASREFAKKISGDITLMLWKDAYHELHHEIEPEKSQSFDCLKEWLDGHCG